ncbi:MAG TPA: type II toxin-antitoxin system HicB family antitoxin [Solirubrobacteraceae bacterium]|nr:type II toxin-antitoxin system HicB family antitoxin [Solirubrobacteraceae bacterium]
MSEQIEIQALVHEEDGSFWAEVPSCPGLFATGDTLDELAEGLREAWLLYHDSDLSSEDGDPSLPNRAGATSALTLRVPAFA